LTINNLVVAYAIILLMYSTRDAGFSATRIIISVVIILGIIASVLVVTFFLLKEQKIVSAKTFTDSIVSNISDNDTKTAFDKFDSSLSTNTSTAYYSWLFWSSSFVNNKVTINKTTPSSDYTNPSLDHLLGNGSVITVMYSTSASSKVSLTAIQQADGWKVVNYASI